jgi:glucosyl-dolichyl phosphate glucuronosyltransferase
MISVVIVTFNRKLLLKKCLQSLTSLDYKKEYEIIVVDNYSQDKTVALINNEFRNKVKLIENDSRLRLSDCKKKAIQIALGDVVTFTDDDCIVTKNWLELIEHSLLNYDIVGGIVLSNPDVKFPWWWRRSLEWLIGLNSKPSSKFLPLGSNIAFRKQVLDRVEDYNDDILTNQQECLQYGEDNCRLNKALRSGFRMSINPEMIVYHCVPETRLSISYLFKRSYAEGRALAKREPTIRNLILRAIAFTVNPVRFLITGDINRIFRMMVSASYILNYFKENGR